MKTSIQVLPQGIILEPTLFLYRGLFCRQSRYYDRCGSHASGLRWIRYRASSHCLGEEAAKQRGSHMAGIGQVSHFGFWADMGANIRPHTKIKLMIVPARA